MNKDIFNTLTVDEQVDYINSKLKEELTLRDIIERELNLPRSTIRNRFTRNKYVFNKRLYRYVRINNSYNRKNQCSNLNIDNKEILKNNDIKTLIDKESFIQKAVDFDDNYKMNDNSFKKEEFQNDKLNDNKNLDDFKQSQSNNCDTNKIDIDDKLNQLRMKIKNNLQNNNEKIDTNPIKEINETKESLNCNLHEKSKEEENSYLQEREIDEIREILKHKNDILNLINKNHCETKECNLNLKLEGEVKVKIFKIYDNILNEFDNFVRRHKEMKAQDVISLALKEFLEKHS